VVGTVDRPFEHSRDPHSVDLSGPGAHLAIVGGPGSGKSTLLRTLVTSLALTHTPREVQFHVMDFGGFGSFSALPHLAETSPGETLTKLTALLATRRHRFAETGDAYDVFLVVDGWTALRNQFPELMPAVSDLLRRGATCGLHVILSASRWSDLEPAHLEDFGNRIELNLGEGSDRSGIDKPAAWEVAQEGPGRGLAVDGSHFQGALPRIDGRRQLDDLEEATAELIARISAGRP
jgi:S-DNA-T family DNA segregation ATPase FtsK/SpoIIIE